MFSILHPDSGKDKVNFQRGQGFLKVMGKIRDFLTTSPIFFCILILLRWGVAAQTIWDAQSSIRKIFPAVLSTARPSSIFGDGLFIYDFRLNLRGEKYVG